MRVLSLFLMCFVIAGTYGQEAADLKRLRESYNAAVERAVKPLTDTYLKELQKLRGSYGRSGMQKELAQVDAEIVAITQKLEALAERSTSVSKVAVIDKEANIPPNDPNGFPLGALRKGDTITLQYVKGMWKDHGLMATVNPDAVEVEGQDNSRMVIAEAAVDGKPGAVVLIIPPGTMESPFVYNVTNTVEAAVLRIKNNSEGKANPGTVTYKVKLER
jgi:hypothetical protein